MLKRLLVALVIGWLPIQASAADPTGQWRLDSQSFQEQFMTIIEAQLADLPEAMRTQMGQMMTGMLDEMKSGMDGVAHFSADGIIRFEADDGEQHGGRWEDLGNDLIRIQPDDPRGEAIEAVLEGDRMVSLIESEEMPGSFELVWIRQ